jgi:hypothetical protein
VDGQNNSLFAFNISTRSGVATNYGFSILQSTVRSAYKFNGTNSFLEVPYTVSLAPTNAVSITAWAWMQNWSTNSTAIAHIMSKAYLGGYSLGLNNFASGHIYFLARRNGVYGQPRFSTANIPSGWHFLAGTYDGRYARLYFDGALVATDDAGGNYPLQYSIGNALHFGASASPSTGPNSPFGGWLGAVGESCVYNRVLSAAEVAALYKEGLR